MIKWTLKRIQLDNDVTIGQLFYQGTFFCWACEDPVRDGPKVKGDTAIPVGSYRILITHSPRFGKLMPILLNVPNYEGIRIHPGNDPGDTNGCLLPGYKRTPKGVMASQAAYADLYRKIEADRRRGEQVWIDVVNAPE